MYIFVDDWIQTTDLLCWKQTLCQLSHTTALKVSHFILKTFLEKIFSQY